MDKITVPADEASDLAGEIGLTVKGLLDALESEIGMTPVDHLEKGNLGVTGKVNVLCTISN
jgi:hypothetical protein